MNMPSQTLRIALYSHDAMGLGHMRRNLLLAQTLVGSRAEASVLMIAGAREAGTFTLPAGVDCLTLPAIRKNGNGDYDSRNLGISYDELIDLRKQTLRAALVAYQPDVVIVDKVPRGIGREMEGTLQYLRSCCGTRAVLGLRDVLDEPPVVRKEWRRERNVEAIRSLYDAVWIYGDGKLYDTINEYQLPADIALKARYTGYFDQRLRLPVGEAVAAELLDSLGLDGRRMMLCMVGGGEDGAQLAESFARAAMPAGSMGVIVTGPFMPGPVRERLLELAAARPDLRVLEFVPEGTLLLSKADRVVAMGGYNTTCEILSFDKTALIVPRVKPRLEQWLRAERLRALGLVDVLHPDALTPDALGAWLAREQAPRPAVRSLIDFDGLSRVRALLDELLEPRLTAPFTWPVQEETRYAAS